MGKERLFKKIKDSIEFRNELSVFSKYLKNDNRHILYESIDDFKTFKMSAIAETVKKEFPKKNQMRSTMDAVYKIIRKAVKDKTVKQEGYCGSRNLLCMPLVSEDMVFGLIVFTGIKKPMSAELLKIFSEFTKCIIRKTRSEIELEEVNKTIRPRVVALSTVHTVHRLMTSTFDLNELFPKIARLALQIIRANRCSIKIVDKKRKVLLPKTTIDVRKTKTKLKKVQIGKYAPGKAVKKGISIRGEKYLATPMIDEDVVGVITLYDRLDGKIFTSFDEEIMKTLSEQAAIAIQNAQLFREQADLTLSSIRCIALLLEHRSDGTHRAEASIFKLISIVGPKFKMNETEITMLQYATMLHDAGQISVPEKLLLKKGGLTGTEYDIVKMHPLKGADILSKFKPLKPIVPIIKYHHENYDGSGYPKGLKGPEIPLAARIMAVVGAFEAMITRKPYRKALSFSAAVRELKRTSGIQFDPKVVDVFCAALQRKDVKKLLQKELNLQ